MPGKIFYRRHHSMVRNISRPQVESFEKKPTKVSNGLFQGMPMNAATGNCCGILWRGRENSINLYIQIALLKEFYDIMY